MQKKLLYSLLLGSLSLSAWGADYGIPAGIQEGNILHCFNWPAKDVEAALPQIAAAGFGSVQLSPCQRPDAKVGYAWHDLYRPYDLAFKSSSWTSEADLRSLCAKAKEYGIKVIVDVVANHVDKTAGYHDTWWDSSGRVRWEGGINYGNRYSITHGQLGDYGDVNSELAEVAARGKAYVEQLKAMGVSGCRWDAAKHIGLPSEGCQFWAQVTSVAGMYHYGEILDSPGPDASIIKEYGKYMAVTDNEYCNYAARQNGGIPGGHGGSWAVNHGLGDKVVYWAESHDTYSNDEWSQNVDQSTIDRAYAAYACRRDATALYLSRPNVTGFNNIKLGKGSTAFTSKHISEVNKFRNVMVGKPDWCEAAGNTFTVTRQNGGAVIVMKGSGNVNVKNGGGYCPAGTYKDRVSGGTFTVTASTISGNVGSSGIAVIYAEGLEPDPVPNPGPTPDPDPTPGPTPGASYYVLGDIDGAHWDTTAGHPFTASGSAYVAKNVKFASATGETTCYFNITDALGADWDEVNMNANRYGAADEGDLLTVGKTSKVVKYTNNVNASACSSWTIAPGTYDLTFDPSALTLSVANAGSDPDPVPGPTPDPDPVPQPTPVEGNFIYFDDMSKSDVAVWAWGENDVNCTASGNWPGDPMTQKDGKYYWELPAGKTMPTNVIISWGNHDDFNRAGGKDLVYVNQATYHADGTYTAYVVPNPGPTPDPDPDPDPNPGPTPDPDPVPVPAGNNLITDYYKVNPNGQVGTFKTVNTTGHPASNAFSNWTAADLIAQGVARDVAQAFKGVHERPIVDSYAIYAAYDNDNLYLGVQFVYTVWDLYGEGKQPGESKPYNMDGHMVLAFDLDPNKSFDGYINGTGPIWNDQAEGAKFANGVDAVIMCSTKPGVGVPGLFIATPDGHASYDAAYCKSLPAGFWGYTDGLHPSIDHVWGQPDFTYDPELLKGNAGFVDLRSEIDDTAHTFYEFKLPLSSLGITADYIKNQGIGFMYLDKYGTSPVGGTPYDPSFFDNVSGSYSQDPSSSQEKEDEDVITYAPARIGKLAQGQQSAIDDLEVVEEDAADAAPVYYTLQGVQVANPGPGLYIVVRGNKVTKEIVR